MINSTQSQLHVYNYKRYVIITLHCDIRNYAILIILIIYNWKFRKQFRRSDRSPIQDNWSSKSPPRSDGHVLEGRGWGELCAWRRAVRRAGAYDGSRRSRRASRRVRATECRVYTPAHVLLCGQPEASWPRFSRFHGETRLAT